MTGAIMTTVCLRQWTAQGVFFVTRMKDNALYEAVGEKTFPKTGISSEMN